MANKTKLITAHEAKQLADTTNDVIKRISHDIHLAALNGSTKVYCNIPFPSRKLLKNIESTLIRNGYDVSILPNSEDDASLEYVDILVSWDK